MEGAEIALRALICVAADARGAVGIFGAEVVLLADAVPRAFSSVGCLEQFFQSPAWRDSVELKGMLLTLVGFLEQVEIILVVLWELPVPWVNHHFLPFGLASASCRHSGTHQRQNDKFHANL